MCLCEFVLTVWDLSCVTDYVLQSGEVTHKKKVCYHNYYIVGTDDKERDRKIVNGKGSLGH